MGLFAPVAAYLAARIGTRRAMTIGLALIGVFGILRAIDAVGVARRAPHLARRDRDGARQRARADLRQGALRGPAGGGHGRLHDGHPGRLDGRGSAGGAARRLALRLARRPDRVLVRGAASLVAWVVLTWGETPHTAPAVSVPRLPWGSRTAWLLVADLRPDGARAYYGLNAWLPDAYSEHGWSDGRAGLSSR